MSGTASRFTISAFCEQGYIQATRCNRASAMCLADDWAESGFSDIQITSPDGVNRSPALFRAGLTARSPRQSAPAEDSGALALEIRFRTSAMRSSSLAAAASLPSSAAISHAVSSALRRSNAQNA
jgi:hypothetical protein